ncbi:MAG: endonuclease III domain-containing protein [Chloroflexi bacterium]|nr:endonuclease III domain-containing protein [Chloroflexota bacterium]
MTLSNRLIDVYQRLYAAYGPQRWWPGDTPFEVIVGAILAQSTAWTNVEKAIANLKAADALSAAGLARLSEEELARMVYPAGYYNAKARKLKAFVEMVRSSFGGEVERLLAAPQEELRGLLLNTHGIGPETADSILLYAAGRPAFVIDAYTRRLFRRLGVAAPQESYESWQSLFTTNLEADAPLFNEYHALIVRHGKGVCRREPRCEGCPLLEVCPTGQARMGAVAAGKQGAPAGKAKPEHEEASRPLLQRIEISLRLQSMAE